VKLAGMLALVLLAVATPTWADAALEQKAVPANADVTVAIAASVDKLGVYNDKLTVEVPDGFRVLSCGQVDGFKCAQAPATGPPRTLVTWQRTAPGQPVPLATDHFPFRMHTIAKAGKYAFALTQTYSNGEAAHSAPMLQVNPAAAAPARTTTTVARVAMHTARPPAATGRAPAPTHVAVTEPPWFGDTSGDAGSQVVVREFGTEQASSSARMVAFGVVTAIAAAGVFWFRRRVGQIS
jgi:hypothetical protein